MHNDEETFTDLCNSVSCSIRDQLVYRIFCEIITPENINLKLNFNSKCTDLATRKKIFTGDECIISWNDVT